MQLEKTTVATFLIAHKSKSAEGFLLAHGVQVERVWRPEWLLPIAVGELSSLPTPPWDRNQEELDQKVS